MKVAKLNLCVYDIISCLCNLGVAITLPDKSSVLCHAILLCTTCDLPARALVLNMVQFNGFYSCCYCLQPDSYSGTQVTYHIRMELNYVCTFNKL